MKYVTLIRLSEEGRKHYGESKELFGKCLEITDSLGGKVLDTFAVGGTFDFVTIAEYPSPEVAFEARIKLYKLGIFELIDGHEAFDMDLFLAKA